MALVTSIPQGNAPATFYNIPDAELAKYKVEARQLPQDQAAGKSKADADGTLPASMVVGGDVQPYSADICFIYNRYTGEILEWWYC